MNELSNITNGTAMLHLPSNAIANYSRAIARIPFLEKKYNSKLYDELLLKFKETNEQFEVFPKMIIILKLNMLSNKDKAINNFDKLGLLSMKYNSESLINIIPHTLRNLPTAHELKREINKSLIFLKTLHVSINELINIFDVMLESKDLNLSRNLKEGYIENYKDDLEIIKEWEEIDLMSLEKYFNKID